MISKKIFYSSKATLGQNQYVNTLITKRQTKDTSMFKVSLFIEKWNKIKLAERQENSVSYSNCE